MICATAFSMATIQAQTITEKYMKLIPALPLDTCNISKVKADNFKQKVVYLSNQIEMEVEQLNNTVDQKSEENEEIAKANAMKQMSQQYGLSPEEMAKMQNGKMSAAEKQAMANKVLQQQTNMSMGEVQNLSKMSDAGKKAYAEAYGTEMMATGQTAQNKQSSDNAKTLNQLLVNQQAVLGKINATSQKIGNLYTSIESDPELQKSFQNIEKWHSKIMSMTGVDYGQGKQMDSLAVLIKNEQIKVCNKFTPRYRAALNQHLSLMKASIPDSYQLGQITAQITKIQTGVEPPAESTEVGNLESIKGYLNMLKDAYKFKLYFPEEN